jgi:hypothetical protein
MSKTTTHCFFLFTVFFYLNFNAVYSQTAILSENQYQFIYKIAPQDDYTYETNIKSPKEAQIKLRKLFESIYSWFENSENTFYIKTVDTLKSLEEYNDIFTSKGVLLVTPIEIYPINLHNPYPSDTYNYKYTLHLQGDFSNWKSKNVLDTLNSLFQTEASWYNSTENVFYIKTIHQIHTVQEYTQTISSYGLVLTQILSVIDLKSTSTSVNINQDKQ